MNTKFSRIECISQAAIDRVAKVTYKQPAHTTTACYKTHEDYAIGNSGPMPHVCRSTFPIALPQKSDSYKFFFPIQVLPFQPLPSLPYELLNVLWDAPAGSYADSGDR